MPINLTGGTLTGALSITPSLTIKGTNVQWSLDNPLASVVFGNQAIGNTYSIQCLTFPDGESYLGIMAKGYFNGNSPVLYINPLNNIYTNTNLNGVTPTQFGYLTTISSNVQTQIETINTSIGTINSNLANYQPTFTLANYSTTAQVLALSNLTNYYTKTTSDDRFLPKTGGSLTCALSVYQNLTIDSATIGDGYTQLILHNNTDVNGHVGIKLIGRSTGGNDGWSFDGRNVINFQTKLLQNGTIYNRFAIQCMETEFSHFGILSGYTNAPIVQWDREGNCIMKNSVNILGNVQNGNIKLNNTMLSNNLIIESNPAIWDHPAQLIVHNNCSHYGRAQIILIGRADFDILGDPTSWINDYWGVEAGRNNVIFSNQLAPNGPTYCRYALQCFQDTAGAHFGICSNYHGNVPILTYNPLNQVNITTSLNLITAAQLAFLTTISSNVQTQINNANAMFGQYYNMASINLITSYLLPKSGGVMTGNLNGVTPTQLSYLTTLSSDIQTQVTTANTNISTVTAQLLTKAPIYGRCFFSASGSASYTYPNSVWKQIFYLTSNIYSTVNNVSGVGAITYLVDGATESYGYIPAGGLYDITCQIVMSNCPVGSGSNDELALQMYIGHPGCTSSINTMFSYLPSFASTTIQGNSGFRTLNTSFCYQCDTPMYYSWGIWSVSSSTEPYLLSMNMKIKQVDSNLF